MKPIKKVREGNRRATKRVWNRKSYCVALLRRGFLRSAIRQQCLVANRKRKADPKTGRMLFYVKCAKCKKWFKQSQIRVDHKNPVVPVEQTLISLDLFAERLYCSVENLQTLCDRCHKIKSKKENQLRRKYRKE